MKSMKLDRKGRGNDIRIESHRIISLGWVCDDEMGFRVVDVSQKALAQEVLRRHRAERAQRPIKIEHAVENAVTVALMHGSDPDEAAKKAESVVLALGFGVSFWLVTEPKYQDWKAVWDKQHELTLPWVESGGEASYDMELFDSLTNQFWGLFEELPLVRISLTDTSMDEEKAVAIADNIFQIAIRKMDESETIG